MLTKSVTTEQILLQEIEESKRSFDREKEEGIYKRDLKKRIELINWVLLNMKNPDIQICTLIESRMNILIDKINETDSIIEGSRSIGWRIKNSGLDFIYCL
jgi:hypothetical protein